MRYRILLHQSEEGFDASVPGLPGCHSSGATEEEAVENIRAAIEEYLAVVESETEGKNVREIEVAPASLDLDDGLIACAQELVGPIARPDLLREGLKALIERESARQLARQGGSEPSLQPIPRRHPESL
jgi:predicted RNase H-like HicB family nuclease